MPEIPDLEMYVRALRARVVGEVVRDVRIAHPFLLRTVSPVPAAAVGRAVLSVTGWENAWCSHWRAVSSWPSTS